MMRRGFVWIPLAIFSFFAGLFLYRMFVPLPDVQPSTAIGRVVPKFSLPSGLAAGAVLQDTDLRDGKPKLVNIFASWCVPCAAEAGQLEQLRAAGVPIYGIAIRDTPEDLAAFLAKFGNPYAKIGSDRESAVQLSMGSSAVPETFVVDSKGVIRRHIQGVITQPMVPRIIAEIKALQ
jgi:cytochrome c biogenesis protein CcmG, thiol:disulfide interchange protein DsbE